MNKYKQFAKRAREVGHRYSSCERKRVFDTREEAFQKGQEVYHCKYCGKWHRTGQIHKLVSFSKRKDLKQGLEV
jgi:hypothetical protein